ncbi:Uncharacterized protein SCF082_LOCUS2244 [Durusdinium trenchii]|uniref:Uncharacterized protein n=1 Tax=Durusdinium trenchii TaxID=1381693 RepID=A0ABP0HL51_9DINO
MDHRAPQGDATDTVQRFVGILAIRAVICTTPADYCIEGPNSFEKLLTKRERDCLQEAQAEYSKRFKADPSSDRNLVVYLGDNFSNRKTWSGSSRRLPTFRTGGGITWWCSERRPMTHREKLASLAFLVSPEVALSMGVPEIPVKDWKRAASVSGNSMNFASVAIAQMIALASFRKAAERQYSQRGRPLAKTCWGIQEVTRFMQSHVKGKSADDDLGAHGCMFADGSPQNPSPMPQFILIKEKWGPEQVEKYERVKVEQSQARLHIALVFLLDLTMFEERTLRLNLVERGFPARSQESPKPLKVPVFQDPTISMEDLEGVEFPQNGYTCEQEQDKFLIQHADLPGLTVQPFGFNWMCTVQNKALIITFSHPISAAKDLFVYRFSGLLKSCLYLEESKVVYT